jgi:hypothetical protein
LPTEEARGQRPSKVRKLPSFRGREKRTRLAMLESGQARICPDL